MQRYDAIVIGLGFGGLAATLALAERGAKVLACETLKYPGGCASTFERKGYRFESGATLFSGFAQGQLFATWIAKYALPVVTQSIDPIVELHTRDFTLAVPPDRARFLDAVCALPGVPADRVRAFFAEQGRVADALWALFDDPRMLPPFGARELFAHVARTSRYLPLVRLLGCPLGKVLERYGLADCVPLRAWLDAVCQITVQCSSGEAEAPFAMAAMDYYFRGTHHVRGGIGVLAHALADAARTAGAELQFADAVRSVGRDGDGWRVTTRNGEAWARTVIANVLPQSVRTLTGLAPGVNARLDRLVAQVEEGWGAVMLYLGVDHQVPMRPEAHHLEVVGDVSLPFTDGNHVFVSISGRDEPERGPWEQRTVTASTHVSIRALRALDPGARIDFIVGIQRRMRETMALHLPVMWSHVRFSMTASPRTFERFTSRPDGYVGGIPRRASRAHYAGMFPSPVLPNLWLVGDSVFPGQSTLATAVGGLNVARAVTGR